MGGQPLPVSTKSLTPRLIAVAVCGCLSAPVVYGLPTAPQVVVGSAAFSQQTGALTVTNTPGTIINWRGFSIGAGEATRFIQQNAQSSVLNRVLGPDASAILGALQSNGRVWLINPNGILFGPSSRVDVQGLVASTLAISDRDFTAGKLNFQAGTAAGAIQNLGAIKTPQGGGVYLVAPDIENTGIIHSPKGEVMLAAGRSVSLVEAANPDVQMVISAPTDKAVNLGQIVVESGRAGLFGMTLAQRGIVSANSVGTDAAGRIVFRAAKDVTLEAGSATSADGAAGGDITVQAPAGTNLAYGQVSAKGSDGRGGSIQLLGERVGLADRASVDASGNAGGGTVLVGGDYQGKNTAIQNASATYVSPEATIAADAGRKGDGGKVVVWSDNTTRFYGTATARGGAEGGDGGFVETSGRSLDVSGGRINASAPKGANGQWLLDPNNVTIRNVQSDSNVTGDSHAPDFESDDDGAVVSTTSIQTALNLGTSVSIATKTAGHNSESGNITVADPINKSGGADATLSLTANNDININADITSSSNKLNLVLNATGATNVAANLATNGGTIDATGGSGIVNFTSGSSTVDGLLTAGAVNVNGGTVNLSVGMSVPAFSLSSDGSVGGSGNLTVTNSFSQSGGSINIGGNASITQSAGDLGLGAITANSITASATLGSVNVQDAVNASGAVALTAGTAVNVSCAASVCGSVQGNAVVVSAPTLSLSSTSSVTPEISAAQSVQIMANAIIFDTASSSHPVRIKATNAADSDNPGFVRLMPYALSGYPVEITRDTQGAGVGDHVLTCAGDYNCLLLSGNDLSNQISAPQLVIGNSGVSGSQTDHTSSGILVSDSIGRSGLIGFDTLGQLHGTGTITADTLAIRAAGAAASFDGSDPTAPLNISVQTLFAQMIGPSPSPLYVSNNSTDLYLGSVTIDSVPYSGITRLNTTTPASAPVTIITSGNLFIPATTPIDAGTGDVALSAQGRIEGTGLISADKLIISAAGAAGGFNEGGVATAPLNTSVNTLAAQITGEFPLPLYVSNRGDLTIGSGSIAGTSYSGITRGGTPPPASAPVTIVSTGSLTVNGSVDDGTGIDAGTGAVYLGAYVDHGDATHASASVTGTGLITGSSVQIEATSNIGSMATPLNTRTGELSLQDYGSDGEISVVNNQGASAPLSLVKAFGPSTIKIENYGGLTVPAGDEGRGVLAGGDITLVAHSPIDIFKTVSTSNGNINLTAGDSTSNLDTLTLHANSVVTTNNGSINLSGNTISTDSNAVVTATGGSINRHSAADDAAAAQAAAQAAAAQAAAAQAAAQAAAKAAADAAAKAAADAAAKAAADAAAKAAADAAAKAAADAAAKAAADAAAKAAADAAAAAADAAAKAAADAAAKAAADAAAAAAAAAQTAAASSDAANQAEKASIAATQALTQTTPVTLTAPVTSTPPTQVASSGDSSSSSGTSGNKDDDSKKTNVQTQPPNPGARTNDRPRNYCN